MRYDTVLKFRWRYIFALQIYMSLVSVTKAVKRCLSELVCVFLMNVFNNKKKLYVIGMWYDGIFFICICIEKARFGGSCGFHLKSVAFS